MKKEDREGLVHQEREQKPVLQLMLTKKRRKMTDKTEVK